MTLYRAVNFVLEELTQEFNGTTNDIRKGLGAQFVVCASTISAILEGLLYSQVITLQNIGIVL